MKVPETRVERSGAQAPAEVAQPPATSAQERGADRGYEPRLEVFVMDVPTPGWEKRVLEVYAHLPKFEHFLQRFGNPARARAEYYTYLFVQKAQISLILSQGYAILPEYDAVFGRWVLVKVLLSERLRKELQRRKRLIERRLARIAKARGE